MTPIKFVLLSDDVKAPTKHLALGYDIYIATPDVIQPHEQENIETNLQLKMERTKSSLFIALPCRCSSCRCS